MTIKEYLSRARYIDREIEELKESYWQAMDAATAVTGRTDGERVKGSGGNGSEDKILRVVEYSERIAAKLTQKVELLAETASVIEQVEDPILRTLLIARYLNGKTWEQTAEAISRSDYWTRTTLHAAALRAAEKFLK